jgi:hypothetical protein
VMKGNQRSVEATTGHNLKGSYRPKDMPHLLPALKNQKNQGLVKADTDEDRLNWSIGGAGNKTNDHCTACPPTDRGRLRTLPLRPTIPQNTHITCREYR